GGGGVWDGGCGGGGDAVLGAGQGVVAAGVGTADHDQDGVVGGRALPRRSEDLRSAAIVGHAPDYMRSGATGFTYRTSSTSALAWIFKIHTISALAGTCTFGTGSPASYPCPTF